jgi:ATP-dependent HslUV protease ATP-binding subunit HslU
MNQSPEQIFAELDRHVIGQVQGKRAVAIALRNRWRRLQLTPEERESIHPHHILMIGPSGVGKTEIARRLAILSDSPFIKVEATQYTEVGYVGKDITSIVEEVVGAASQLLHQQASRKESERQAVLKDAKSKTKQKPVDKVEPPTPFMEFREEALSKMVALFELTRMITELETAVKDSKLADFETTDWDENTKHHITTQIRTADPEVNMIKVFVPAFFTDPFDKRFESSSDVLGLSVTQIIIPLMDVDDAVSEIDKERLKELEKITAAGIKNFKKATKQISIGKLKEMWYKCAEVEAIKATAKGNIKDKFTQELDEFVNNLGKNFGFSGGGFGGAPSYKSIGTEDAVSYAENYGIIFIDEFDKLAGVASDRGQVSRQGVQRDLLPLLDGCVIKTKYGNVDTTNMLFICSGAFQLNKPEELMVEVQGRLPIRVHMEALSVDDFVKILQVKEDNILEQYRKLMAADGVDLVFEEAAVKAIADIAFNLNLNYGNYGARRLYGCVEKVLEDVTYLSAPNERITMTISEAYVKARIGKA